MDVAAAGAASAQISAGQRAQQVSIAALRSNQLQAQSMASMLASAAGSSASAAQPAAPAASGGDTGGGSSNASNAASPRGSLLNILV